MADLRRLCLDILPQIILAYQVNQLTNGDTSVTTFLVLAIIFLFGGDSIRSFSFAMILGVIFGTL